MNNHRTVRTFRALLLAGFALACISQARASTNDCSDHPRESDYRPAASDTEDATHLTVSRDFTGQGRLELNTCSGELRVRRAKDGALHLQVELRETAPLKMRAYVRTLNVAPDRATISLQFPRKYHPVITLELPSTATLQSEINLGAGSLAFGADGITGNREINVGYGDATLYLVRDKDYAQLETNVGMGSFHDHRPESKSSRHFIISKEMAGTGSGQLEVNVGSGSIDLEPAED